jgi:hypothetical protein
MVLFKGMMLALLVAVIVVAYMYYVETKNGQGG